MMQRSINRLALIGGGLMLFLAACGLPGTGTHTLTVNVEGDGNGTVTSEPTGIDVSSGEATATFDEGTVVTLTALPGADSTFEGWGGACENDQGTCVVTMDDARTVTATFTEDEPEPQEFTLTVDTTGDGDGTVTSDPAGIDCGDTCGATFDEGESVTLTAQPAQGSFFAGWQGACTNATGDCTVPMNSDQTVTAAFTTEEPDTVDLTVDFLGEGSGTVTSAPGGIDCTDDCTASFATGQEVTLTADADAGSTFEGWSGNCALDGEGDCVITVDDDTTVEATFGQADPGEWQQGDPMAFVIEGEGQSSVNVAAEAQEAGSPPVLVIETEGAAPLEVPVAASDDDAEEWLESVTVGATTYDPNTVYATSDDLELTFDSSSAYQTNQLVGLRFASVDLPVDATITSAYIRFTAFGDSSGGQQVTMYGEAEANPQPYPCEFAGDGTCPTDRPKISERARTSATVNWTPSNWSDDDTVQTSDVTPIVQEIIGQ